MTRRLLLLNGLAILAVVIQHAAHTFPLPMFWWTFRYIPGSVVPNYDQFGSVTYYVLIAIIKLSFVAVPSFLFVSGYFVSVVSRGHQAKVSWKWVRATILRLLVPYLIWSLATFLIDWLQSCLDVCTANSLGQYIIILLTGRAHAAYWYVLLVCQLYLLSPLLVILAKTRLRLLLIITILVHVCVLTVSYLKIFVNVPIANFVFNDTLFFRDMIYFVFGIVAGLHLTVLKQWLARFKRFLLVALVISAILTLVEAEFLYRISGGGLNYLKHTLGGYFTVPMTMYIFMVILCFLAFDNVNYPFSKILFQQIGPKSYGIYLLHPFFIQFVPKIFYHLAPWLLAHQILYQPALITISLGIPILFMTLVEKSRMRSAYRYLFG